MRARDLCTVFFVLSSLAAGQPAFDGEFLVDTAGRGRQQLPDVAFDGTNFLVVWEFFARSMLDIYCARVSPSGAVLDTPGIAITSASGDLRHCAATFDGTNFLVVWGYDRGSTWRDIYGARVAPDGTVLDPGGFAISEWERHQEYPAVASDGTNSFVVWYDERDVNYGKVYGARVTPSGAVLDPQGIPISPESTKARFSAVAFDGENYLVVWEGWRDDEDEDIYGARVRPDGTVLDPQGFVVAEGVGRHLEPAVCSGDTSLLVTWTDNRNGHDYDIYAARVRPDGSVLDPEGIAVSAADTDQVYSDLVFDGTNFLVVWADERHGYDIYGAHVSPGGAVLRRGLVLSQTGEQDFPAVSRGGNSTFLVFEGWAGNVGGKTYNTQRIWGKMDPNPGVEETEHREVRIEKAGATVVRGVLVMPAAPLSTHYSLLSTDGRNVADLVPGVNDVRRLSPGVYFVREGPLASSLKPQSVRKVVVQR